MPDLSSALPAARTEGGLAVIREMGLQGMITLKTDLADPATGAAITAVTGLALPARRRITEGPEGAVAWMAPDELLILCPHGAAGQVLAGLETALADRHHLALDVSDARAIFAIEGAGLREVLAKLAPVDLDPARLGPGEMRRTRIAQIPAAFWMTGPEAARLICFRSVARYAFDILALSARPEGRVGYF